MQHSETLCGHMMSKDGLIIRNGPWQYTPTQRVMFVQPSGREAQCVVCVEPLADLRAQPLPHRASDHIITQAATILYRSLVLFDRPMSSTV